jgi:hypothetical protein
VNVAQMTRYMEEGHFPAGSMLPKIVASLAFLHHGGKRVIITSPCLRALRGETGTHIVNEGDKMSEIKAAVNLSARAAKWSPPARCLAHRPVAYAADPRRTTCETKADDHHRETLLSGQRAAGSRV